MEQQTGSKLGKAYIKGICCHRASLTSAAIGDATVGREGGRETLFLFAYHITVSSVPPKFPIG